jgi:two-component system sensor histidine kinase KdpD
VLVVVTAVLIPLRSGLDQAHVVLTYLLVVLGASASGGRALGLALACAGFLLIDYFFQPPFDTITVGKTPDMIVLLAFLATAAVATQLLARARRQTRLAEERAREIDRFASLGAETLNVGRAEDALTAITTVIRASVGVARCEIAMGGGAAGERVFASDDGRRVDDAQTMEIPLDVRGSAVGTLRLVHPLPITLSTSQRRSLEALAYYAALAVERVRLSTEAEHAAALREADRLKDALLAAVSHDLRTPLTAIKSIAHESAARGDEGARIIEEQADRLNHLVADLLDLSRLNGGALQMRPEVAAAEDLASTALRQASQVHGAQRIVPVIDTEGPLLVGCFDFEQSLRVLENLIGNAVKYAPPSSAIELHVTREGDELVFAVADRGPGVPESEREQIFAPFYRGAHASPDVGGAGLGLAIARRLAVAQGGSLSYAPRPGGGSVFTLRLPAVDIAIPSDDPGLLRESEVST